MKRVLGLMAGVLLATSGNALPSMVSAASASPSRTGGPDVGQQLIRTAEPLSQKERVLRLSSQRSGGTAVRQPVISGGVTCNSTWNAVGSRNVGSSGSELNATAAVAANDIWAVGDYLSGTVRKTLAEHWDGSGWTVVTTPVRGSGDNLLLSVAAVASNDVWAVGFARPDNSSARQSLTEHWNGSTWSVVGSPQGLNASTSLFGVSARSSSDVWAVGRAFVSATSFTAFGIHWDGSVWSAKTPLSPSAASELSAIQIVSGGDAWAVGDQNSGTALQTLAEHWIAATSSWSLVTTDNSNTNGEFLSAISGIAGDLWAVGGQFASSTTDIPLAQHSVAGGNFAAVMTPTQDLSANLIGVRYLAANNVYAVGGSAYASPGTASETDHTLIEQYNGTAWNLVTSANPGVNADLFDAAPISANDAWAVGFNVPTGSSTSETLTENVCTPAVVSSIAPATGPTAGGTPVTIMGTGFLGTTAVNFGTTAASFTVVSDTQITTTSPPQAQATVDVTVVQGGGTSAKSAADMFAYVAPTPAVTSVNPTSGPTIGGTAVTINGSGFSFATAVKFGSVAATGYTVNSDTKITATAPAQAQGTVDVVVTTAGGTNPATAADQYSYVAPAPVVTGVSPNAGTPLGGDSVTITGSGFSFATGVSFNAVPATGVTVVSDTQITATSPAQAVGTVADVKVTTAGGTSPVSASDKFTYGPVVKQVTPNTGPVAGGTSVTITGEGFTGATSVKFGSASATNVIVVSDTKITATSPAAQSGGAVDVTVTVATTTSATSAADKFTYAAGYWLVASDGGIFTFGGAGYFGSTGNLTLNKPVVGMARTSDDKGYWLVASDGGIFTFGDAKYFGSTGNIVLNKPVVGMARTLDDKGYWLVASDGGIFTFGDAKYFGSTGNISLNKPIVGMAVTPDGLGYWLVASDGGIFTFGDAKYFGSTGNIVLNKPVVGMGATPDGMGYWLAASDGGIFTFGDARYFGSTGNLVLNQPVVGMAATADGKGYWLVASDGGIFNFGDALYYGSTGNIHLNKPIVGMAPA